MKYEVGVLPFAWLLFSVVSGRDLTEQPHLPYPTLATSTGDKPPPHPTLATSMGWQYGKTLAECNRYMLEYQLATDIGFLVGPRGEAKSLVRAHRYVLLSRSAVFSKLLQQNNAIDKDQLPASSEYQNTSQKTGHPLQTIEIPDMDPAVFKQLLNFIYTDSATLDVHNVIPVMYAAKNYQMSNLIYECQKVLQQTISTENVCIILNQAFIFNEYELINKSLQFIGIYAEKVLKTDGFNQLSRAALHAVITYDNLDANESIVFKSCLRWAKAKMSMKNSTLEQGLEELRNILGDEIYYIRFPIMKQKEFADLLGTSNLLTCDEKASIYYYIATSDHVNNTLAFDWRRRVRARVVDRFDTFISDPWRCHSGSQFEMVKFSVSQTIYLKAVGTYQIWDPNRHGMPPPGDIFTLSISLTRSSQLHETHGYAKTKVGGTESFNFSQGGQNRSYIIEVPLDESVKLEPNYFYTLSLKLPNSRYCFAGYGRNTRGVPVQSDNVSLNFYDAGTSTNENQGQFPHLYYLIP